MIVFNYKYFHVLLLSTILLFSGCTYKKEFTPKTREKQMAHYTKLGLSIPKEQVNIHNDIDPNVLTGVGYGTHTCARFSDPLLHIGPPLSFFAFAVCMPFGITFGAIGGHIESKKLKKLEKEKGTIQTSMDSKEFYNRVQNIISTYAEENGLDITIVTTTFESNDKNQTINYSLSASNGIDTILEFKIDKIELDEQSLIGIPIQIYLKLSGKLLKASNGEILDTDIKEISSKHPYKEWLDNDFELLNKEFNYMLETATKSIIDELLFLYYPTLQEKMSDRTAPFYVLKAYYPKVTFERFSNDEIINGSSHVFTKIHEQQPLLHWESFPWKYDAMPKERFSDIAYDLEIYDFNTGDLVYERKKLKSNKHKVEIELKIDTKYLWRVRSSFKLDDIPRLTEWSGVYENSVLDVPAWKFGTDQAWSNWGRRTLQSKKYFSYAFIIEKD